MRLLKYYMCVFKGVLYSMLGPDLLGLTVNVNFSIFCALLYHTPLNNWGCLLVCQA